MNQAVSQTTDRGLVDAHLSLALEAGQMGTWYWDLATNAVVWSAIVHRIFGRDAEKGGFGGTLEAFEHLVHPADLVRVRDSIAFALAGSADYSVDFRIVRPDGSIRWVEARGRLLRDSEGRPARLIGVCSDITARTEATLRLQLSEAFYSATIMSVAEAVVTTDPEGRITLMNGVAESLTGWQIGQARGRRFDEVVSMIADPAPIADRLAPRRNIHVVAEPASVEPTPSAPLTAARRAKLLLRRDGSRIAIDDSAAPIRDTYGEIVGQVVVFRDVTEERQDEARRWFIAEASALLTSSLDFEKTLTMIAELAVPRIADWCAIHVVTETGRLQRLVAAHKDPAKLEIAARMQQFERLGPSTVSEVVRTGKSAFIAEVSEERLRAVAQSDEHFEMLRGLGLQSHMAVPFRAGDRILGAISFVTAGGTRLDGRDLQMAEELGRRAGTAIDNARLYEEAQRARRVAESSVARASLIQEVTAAFSHAPTPSIVAEVVTRLGTKAIGAAAATLFELSRAGDELVLVRSVGYPEELLEGYGRLSMSSSLPMVESVKTGRPMFFQERQQMDDAWPGLLKPVATFASWAALPLEVEGRRLGALGISYKERRNFDETERDFIVTLSRLCAQALERANLYEAAQEARAEAESSRRARENLLAIVSHDLRNPLSAIATTAGILAKTEPTRDTSGRIARAGTNILRAAQRMDRLIVDLLDLAKIESGRLLLERRTHDAASLVKDSVEILAPVASGKGLVLTADVPAPELSICCDRERVLQVLSNLVGNALKFTAEGGSINVSARERNGEVKFSVADSGCGIEADQLPHIFDRYWQAKSARDGIGLGLSIAKGIVDAHGGRIWVETKIGEGTTFFFTLPKDPLNGDAPSEAGAVKL